MPVNGLKSASFYFISVFYVLFCACKIRLQPFAVNLNCRKEIYSFFSSFTSNFIIQKFHGSMILIKVAMLLSLCEIFHFIDQLLFCRWFGITYVSLVIFSFSSSVSFWLFVRATLCCVLREFMLKFIYIFFARSQNLFILFGTRRMKYSFTNQRTIYFVRYIDDKQ